MFWFIYKITLVVIVMIIIAVYFKDRELFKSQIFNLFTTGEFIILLTPIINTLLIIYGVYRAIQITTKMIGSKYCVEYYFMTRIIYQFKVLLLSLQLLMRKQYKKHKIILQVK